MSNTLPEDIQFPEWIKKYRYQVMSESETKEVKLLLEELAKVLHSRESLEFISRKGLDFCVSRFSKT